MHQEAYRSECSMHVLRLCFSCPCTAAGMGAVRIVCGCLCLALLEHGEHTQIVRRLRSALNGFQGFVGKDRPEVMAQH